MWGTVIVALGCAGVACLGIRTLFSPEPFVRWHARIGRALLKAVNAPEPSGRTPASVYERLWEYTMLAPENPGAFPLAMLVTRVIASLFVVVGFGILAVVLTTACIALASELV